MWCVHGCLGGLLGGPGYEHCLLERLAILVVWGLGEILLRSFGPKSFYLKELIEYQIGIYRRESSWLGPSYHYADLMLYK